MRASRTTEPLGLPFLLHGRTDVNIPHAFLDIDNEGAFPARHQPPDRPRAPAHRHDQRSGGARAFAIHRDRGYKSAMLARGLVPDPQLSGGGRFTDENGFRLAQAFLERRPRPTAFLAGSMMTALGVFPRPAAGRARTRPRRLDDRA